MPREMQTPLPKVQLTVLMYIHLCGPITSTVIFPFIAKLVNEVGVTNGDETAIGYYVGLIESLFFLAEGLCVLQWGRLSDRIGRRPVICIGLLGLAASMTCFGLSKTFAGLVLSRALSGSLNGNTGTIKSVVAEISDDSNRAGAFSMIPVSWIIGTSFGPFIGGVLQNPADRWPAVFGNSPVWSTYPYLLPCGVAALFPLLGVLLGTFVLRETFPYRDRNVHTKEDETEMVPLFDDNDEESHNRPKSRQTLSSLLTRPVALVIVNYSFLAILEITFWAIIPVFLAIPPRSGGLGLDPSMIGQILALIGVGGGIIQIFLFPRLFATLGGKVIFSCGISAYLVMFTALPIMHRIALATTNYDSGHLPMGIIFTLIAMGSMTIWSDMGYSCVFMSMTSAVASPDVLGATNGVAQTAVSFVRAVGPAAATSLFSFSVERNLVGGYLVYIILLGLTSGALVGSRLFPDIKRNEVIEVALPDTD